MLTSQKVIDAINEQIGYEFSAELQYYAIAAHFATEALPQLSQHFFRQAEEEKGHALRFIKYVVDAGGRVVIPGIDAPKSKFKTARDAVKLSLDQEIQIAFEPARLMTHLFAPRDQLEIDRAVAKFLEISIWRRFAQGRRMFAGRSNNFRRCNLLGRRCVIRQLKQCC